MCNALGNGCQAVENASVVVICLSATYKESANCRAEAEYAFKLGKPLMFLKAEPVGPCPPLRCGCVSCSNAQ